MRTWNASVTPLLLLLTSCGHPPSSGGTGGTGPCGPAIDAGPFTLESSAFAPGGPIPDKYLCPLVQGGQNITPPLNWTAGPPGTQSYAIIMDGGNSTQWLIWDIPANVHDLPEGIEHSFSPSIPAGAKQSALPTNLIGYYGPCTFNVGPVTFTLYAMNAATIPDLDPKNYAQARQAIEDGSIGTALLSAQNPASVPDSADILTPERP